MNLEGVENELADIRRVVADFTGKVLASIEKALDQPPPVCTGSGTVPNWVDEREGPCPICNWCVRATRNGILVETHPWRGVR